MPEAIPDQVADAIVTQLQAIVGDLGATYWYTPGLVRRAHVVSDQVLQASLETIYVLTPDRKTEERKAFGTGSVPIEATQFLTLTLLGRFQTSNELNADPSRWTIQERMKRDITKKLLEDPTLGGLTFALDLTDSIEEPENYVDGWAVVFQRLEARYVYDQATP